MGNDMRTEFEDYVKKLTTAICKDILLEKMEELYNKYEAGYQNVDASAKNVMDASKALQTETKRVDNALANIAINIEMLESDSKIIFTKLREENKESKESFIQNLSESIEKYKKETADIFEEGNRNISDKLASIITPEILQGFVKEIEENTKKSQELVTFINETYEREIEDSIKQIIAESKKSQDTMNDAIAVYVRKVLADLDTASEHTENRISQYAQMSVKLMSKELSIFQNRLVEMINKEEREREEYLQKQIELVEKIGPSDKKMQELVEHVEYLENLVKTRDRVNEEKMKMLIEKMNDYILQQKTLERKKQENEHLIKEQAAGISWRIYMAFSNTVLMCMFALVLIILKPWEIYGIKYTLIVVAVFIGVTILVLIFRQIIARMIAKRRAEKYAEQFK